MRPRRTALAGLAGAALLAALVPTAAAAAVPEVSVQVGGLGQGSVGAVAYVDAYVHTSGSEGGPVALTVSVPAGLTLDDLRPEQGLSCAAARCTGTLPSDGRALSVRVGVVPTAEGTHQVTVTLDPTGDTTPADDTATADVVAGAAQRTVSVEPLPAEYGHGQQLRLKGQAVRTDGQPFGRGGVYLQRRGSATEPWSEPTMGYAPTDDAGRFEFRLVAEPADVRVFASGTVSAVVQVRPVLRPVVSLDPVRLPPGGTSQISAYVQGPVEGRTFAIERWTGTGWQVLTSRSLTGPASLASLLVRLPTGTHRYRATVSGEGTKAAEVSLPVSMAGRGNAAAWRTAGGTRTPSAIRWDPCRVINVKINAYAMPPAALQDAIEAVRRVALGSGLPLRYAGTTRFVPQGTAHRADVPLVIAWATPAQSRMLSSTGGEAGRGGWSSNGSRIVTGAVVLDSRSRIKPGFGAGGTVGSLLMHEIGHAVGLQHVDDRSQIMYPLLVGADATMWGAGDLNGLKALGRPAGCIRG